MSNYRSSIPLDTTPRFDKEKVTITKKVKSKEKKSGKLVERYKEKSGGKVHKEKIVYDKDGNIIKKKHKTRRTLKKMVKDFDAKRNYRP